MHLWPAIAQYSQALPVHVLFMRCVLVRRPTHCGPTRFLHAAALYALPVRRSPTHSSGAAVQALAVHGQAHGRQPVVHVDHLQAHEHVSGWDRGRHLPVRGKEYRVDGSQPLHMQPGSRARIELVR